MTILRLIPLITLIACSLLFSGCGLGSDDDDELEGNWIRQSDFEGIPRSGSVSFTIGNLGYVGLGYDGDDDLRDVWSYDPNLNFWTRVDSFPGAARRAAVAFTVGDRAYVGTGYNSDTELEYSDFWAFDPSAESGNQWTQIPNFPGSARYNAVSFSDAEKGYVGSGFDDNWLKDFYAYNPSTDSWEQIVSIGGSKREGAVAFSINGLHYVGTGRNNGFNELDFWRYDPSEGVWFQLNDLDEDDDYRIARSAAVAFTFEGKGYITTGSSGFNDNSVWEYDPAVDEWTERTAFEGVSRSQAVALMIDGRVFITTGSTGASYFDDLREFRPNEEYDEND